MTYTPDDLYDMFANQADATAIANTSITSLALDIADMDEDGTIGDYEAAARTVQAIAADLAARASAARALRSIPSEKRAAASRANGRKGGRPRKTPQGKE